MGRSHGLLVLVSADRGRGRTDLPPVLTRGVRGVERVGLIGGGCQRGTRTGSTAPLGFVYNRTRPRKKKNLNLPLDLPRFIFILLLEF